MSIEDRILDVVASQVGWFGGQELRAIALEVRKREDRVKQLEEENDAMRADLLLWSDNLRLQQRINKLEQENESLRADLLLREEKEVKL